MSKMVLNYWPSLLLSLVLLTGIVACLKRLDCLVVEDVRALISIIFGFATSCLLLSFIWLIQRKPLHRSWPHQHITIGGEVPSLHPRGRASISDSYDGDHMTINTISNGHLDIPPAYEDALLNSKPFYRHDKAAEVAATGSYLLSCGSSSNTHITADLSQDGTSGKVHRQAKHQCPTSDTTKYTARVSLTSGYPQNHRNNSHDDRKISFVHLDVGQLALSSSPPKYHELQFSLSGETHSQRNTDKTSVDMP